MNWYERPIEERVAIRREMVKQATIATDGLFASRGQQRAAVRTLVDSSLAKERMGYATSQGQEQVDGPDAEDDDDEDASDLGEGLGQGNHGENPPNQPEDQTHDKNSNEN